MTTRRGRYAGGFDDTRETDQLTPTNDAETLNTSYPTAYDEARQKMHKKNFKAATRFAAWFALATAITALVLASILFPHRHDDHHHLEVGQFSCDKDQVNRFTIERQEPDVDRMNWPSWGRDYAGTRYNPHIEGYDLDDDDQENALVYTVDSTSGVSTTITLDEEGFLYFGDWGDEDAAGTISDAKLYKVDSANGNTEWKITVSSISADPHTAVRTSLTQFTDNTGMEGVFFCDLGTPNLTCSSTNGTLNDAACGAYCYALQRDDGSLMWRTKVSDQPEALVTASANIVGQFAYFGLSSREAALLESDSFTDPTFVGEMYALNLNNGELVYTQPTIFGDKAENLTGAAVWGSMIPYDITTDTAVFGTGNLYSLNDNVTDCLNTVGENAWTCLPNKVWPDSLIAIRGDLWGHREVRDMNEKWVFSAQGVDAWNLACLSDPEGANCPDIEGPDYDFGAGAIIVTNECNQRLVISLQKSGTLWAFNLDTGKEEYRTYVGPGSTLNNNWGAAFDGRKIYLSFGNSEGKRYRTMDGTVRCDGFFAAVYAFSGNIDWITPLPNSRASSACPAAVVDATQTRYFDNDVLLFTNRGPTQNLEGAVSSHPNPEEDATRDTSDFSLATGPVTVANGVVYAGAWNGYMYKIDPQNGDIRHALKRCPTGSIYGGLSIGRFETDTDRFEVATYGCGYTNLDGTQGGNSVIIYRRSD